MRNVTLTKLLVSAVVIGVYLFSSNASIADTVSGKLMVSAVVVSNCNVKVENIQFGQYDPNGKNKNEPLNAVGSIGMNCTKGTMANVTIDAGMHSGAATGTTRAMVNSDGVAYLAYDVYQDAGKQNKWSNESSVNYTAESSGEIKMNVYAQVSENQEVPTGYYTDILTVSVNY